MDYLREMKAKLVPDQAKKIYKHFGLLVECLQIK